MMLFFDNGVLRNPQFRCKYEHVAAKLRKNRLFY